MTIEENFSLLAEHMTTGIMFHEQMANCYGFLSLHGYKQCHEYHYYSEICNYRRLYNYSLEFLDKLIKVNEIKNPTVINASWYKYSRIEVDINTKRTAIRELMKKWVEWEKETKKLLEKTYKDLYDAGEIATAMEIYNYIKDVSEELKNAENKQIYLETIGYDINLIMEEQEPLYKKYTKKIGCLND